LEEVNDRFREIGYVTAKGLSLVRRVSAWAIAEPAKGGKVRLAAVGTKRSECPLPALHSKGPRNRSAN